MSEHYYTTSPESAHHYENCSWEYRGEQMQFLTDAGDVRHVLLSEQGFTSSSGGEGVQAAAFAYAYLAKDSGVCELPQPFNDK
mgnify:CR=1 FL=1